MYRTRLRLGEPDLWAYTENDGVRLFVLEILGSATLRALVTARSVMPIPRGDASTYSSPDGHDDMTGNRVIVVGGPP
jgi:hypothetical protein